MSLPLLITGGTKQARKNKALTLASENSAAFDTTVFDTEEAAGIDTIRNLGQTLTRRPFKSKQQSIVLLEAQNLTIEAQNAFLKNLEEGSPSAKIILTSATAEGLLSTVTSRCQKIELPVEIEKITDADWQFFKSFLQRGHYEQYASADKLDLDRWSLLWRKILLSSLGAETSPLSVKAKASELLRYLKLINKICALRKRRAAMRLLKTILILEAPKIETDE